MKQTEIEISGKIDDNGKLAMYMGELNEFLAKWKGARVIATFKVVPKGTSEALKSYYFKVVVPSVRRKMWELGTRMTYAQIEIFLKENSPIMLDEVVDVNGISSVKLRDISSLSVIELSEHIDTIKQFAAENFNLYIEDPKTL